MASVPYTGAGPEVAPDARPPDDLQRIDASPEAFGAAIGRGLQQLGEGVEKAERFDGQVAADDATNAYQSQATKLLYGDPNRKVQQPDGTMGPDTGFLGLRGDAAMRARPGIEAQLDQLQQQGSAGLTSPESRLQFESYTRRLRTNLAERIGQHAEQQATVYRTGVNDSTAELARQSIAANPEDPEALKHGLADLTAARVKEAQATSGGDPTVMAAAAQRARGEGAVTQVEALLNRNPTLAKQTLEANRGILPPQTYDTLVNRLRPMLSGDQADEAIRRAAGGQPVQGGPVMHTPPAGGSGRVTDADAFAAEQRLRAGTGTDADRALRATYLAQQNAPAGQQPAASPAAQPAQPSATPAASAPSGLPQEGPMPPARGDGGPPTSPGAGTIQQPTYAAWRGTLSKDDRAQFDRIALRDATTGKIPLPQAQAALFQRFADTATARGQTLNGGTPAGSAPAPAQPVAAPAQSQQSPAAAPQARTAPAINSLAPSVAAVTPYSRDAYDRWYGGLSDGDKEYFAGRITERAQKEGVSHDQARREIFDAVHAPQQHGTAQPYSPAAYDDWSSKLSREDRASFDDLVAQKQRQQGITQDAARRQVFDTMQAAYVRGDAPRPGTAAPTAQPAVTSPRHADFVSAQQLKAAEAAAQVRDRKPVLSAEDKAADAADQQLLDRYKLSHGIPRTTGVDIARLPDDPPGAIRDTSADPVPHPDTHVIPPHPHVGPSAAPAPTFAQSAAGLPTPVPGAAATPFFAQVGAPYGISGNYLARTKQIESGSGSGAHAVSSSGAQGPYQFTAGTARRMGLTDPNDLAKSADAAARLAAENRTALTRSLGRAPDDSELYLAHQQGSGGAAKLIANPNTRAGDLVGDSAIRSNGGDPNAPASAFVQKWRDKFNGIKTTALPSFATGFGAGQPYFGGAPAPGVVPPLPSPMPLPDPVQPSPVVPQPSPAPSAPAGLAPPPAAPSMGQVPPPLPIAQQVPQALPPPVAFNADDPSSPLPDRAMALAHARALAGGDPIQARMNVAEVNRRYQEQNALTATERMELAAQLPDLNAAASAGVDGVTLPERDIRRLYPPAKAEQIIGSFHANQAVGALMRGVQYASPEQLDEMQRDLSSGLGVYSDALRSHRGRASTGPGTTGAQEDGADLGFFRRRELASKQIAAEINHRAALLVGPEADPAAYVAAHPAVRQADAGRDFSGYANAVLGVQSYLGVPEAQQHVLTRGQAIGLAGRIMAAPDPKAELQRQATAAGSAWPKVFGDAMSLGRLPPSYQAVATLDDPHDAALLSRTLASERPGPDGKPGKAVDDTVDTMAGAKGEATKVRDAVRFDPDVRSYVASIQRSGASADQVQGIVNSVETLALAKRAAGEAGDSGSAAAAAVKSFFGRFSYMPNGGARVPSKRFDAVTANAQATLDGLALDHVMVPERFGQPGQPEPQEYIDTIKAAPTWVTSPRSDAIWLMDYAGRFVRGRDGQPVAVPFNLPGPQPVVRAPPLAGVSTLPIAPQAGIPLSPAAAAAARAAAANPAANMVPGL